LVAINDAIIQMSYATGSVTGGDSLYAAGIVIGGVAGINEGSINSSYAMGAVTGGKNSSAGGLAGICGDACTVSFSYSTGAVVGGAGSYVGGLVGYDASQSGSLNDTYWDVDTSGITDPSQGAGNIPNDPGIMGLTTAQFQSGLPQGFDPDVWAEKSTILDGFPYLIANPP
jgi:hypothetical protein